MCYTCLTALPLLSLFSSPNAGTGRSIVKKPRLQVHPDFPYVSTAVMQGGSPDFIVGVSQMSLCNEDKWPKKIQMCGELFSTNTSHIILGGESHSVQGGNCSFGYFEFQLNRVKEMDPSPDSCSCQPKSEQSRINARVFERSAMCNK